MLLLAIILLVIAIAGGVVIHPLIFILALVALWLFFTNRVGSDHDLRHDAQRPAR